MKLRCLAIAAAIVLSAALAQAQSATLSWTLTGPTATSLFLSCTPCTSAPVDVLGLTSYVVSPTITTTYTLTASDADGSSSRSTIVTVLARVLTFSASLTTVVPGGSSSLTWTTRGGTGATLNGAAVALNGSQSVTPLTTTIYTLVVSNPSSVASRALTVNAGALPMISSWTATPSTIPLGSSSTLTLASTGGTTCSINQGVGTVACNSSTSVSPLTSKLYTVTVTNSFGSKTAQVLVGVSISALVGASVVNGQVVIH